MALCPFHDDHDPSMHIDETLGLYHCFACGASGDAVSFIQRKESCDFLEAAQKACDICGISCSLQSSPQNTEHAKLYEINSIFCHYFEQHLLNEPKIIDYLKKRNINLDQITKYRIGYAPLNTEGQLKRKPMANHFNHSHFAGRIIFPIINADGKIAGFGGRSLEPNSKNKYVNSSESPIFNKKQLAYGMQYLGNDKGKPLYVVEGYLDAIKLQGLDYRAASLMGTSCSPTLFKSLAAKTNLLVLALDRDQAGVAALENIINQTVLPSLNKNMDVRVALYREKDPADAIDNSNFNHKIIPLAQYCQFYLEKKYKNNKKAFEEFYALSKKIPDPAVRKNFYSKWEKNYYEKKAGQEKIQHIVANSYLADNKKNYYVECVQNFPTILSDIDKKLKSCHNRPELDEYLDNVFNHILALAESRKTIARKQTVSAEKYQCLLNVLTNLILNDCINFLHRKNKINQPEEKNEKLLKNLIELAKIIRK